MSPEIHQRVRLLFDDALERPEAERDQFLQTACGGDSEVFRQVMQLLAAHAQAGHFLEGERALPQRIGRYMVTGELGRGSMGIVYRAIDPLIGRDVAVKVIRLQPLADRRESAFLRERLFREARTAGSLFHPGIVVILDVGQEGDVPYIAMEYVEGPSLFQVLAAHPRTARAEALRILQQTAAALDFAHGKGVVHRDIKPANIMLEKGVTVKVADFGIAKIASSKNYTKTGVTMGTPSYMSPEQLDAKPLDGRSDQFSLAVVAYELLTGAQPFQAESFTALARAIADGPRPSACATNPELPVRVDPVFYRGLAKRPEDRYADCREFIAALERALTGQAYGTEGGQVSAVRNLAGKPSRYIVGGTAAAMLLACAGLGYKWVIRSPTAPPAVPHIERFSAYPPSIEAGAKVTLSWEVSGAIEVTVDQDIGKRPATDQVLVMPLRSTYYVLHAASAAGTVFQEAFVEVEPSPVSLCLEAESKLRRKQFAEGVGLLRQCAALGETHAMMELGEFYWEGRKVRKDEPEALRWFQMAAYAGDREGMLHLGVFYETGIGAREDDETAAKWYREAADRGSSDATYDLAEMYEDGRGVPRNLVQARVLYQRAARMGSADAKKWLAQSASH
jgi:hypothetical protein